MSFWYRLRTESKKNLEIDVFIVQEGLYGVYADVAYYRQIIDFHINPEAGWQLKDFLCHTTIKRLFILFSTAVVYWF